MASFALTTAFSCSALAIFMLLLQLQLQTIHAVHKIEPLVPALIAFGDSIVDPGNNVKLLTVLRCDFPPYGMDFIGHEATGRFSNGKITTDFLASSLGVKELLPAYSEAGKQDLLTGVSFASGGTGYDIVTAQLALVTSMSKQIQMFKEYKEKVRSMVGEKKTASIISKSLCIVCAGSNDVVMYFDHTWRNKTHDIPSYADFLMQSASNFTKELVSLGAKKIGVIGIPPIGCVPSQRTKTGDCALNRNQLAQLYNSKISRELQRLSSSLQEIKLIYIDIYSTLLDLIQNPKNQGFEESTMGCCGQGKLEVAILCNRFSGTCKNTSSYVFFDSFHPTERANKIIVDQLVKKYSHFLI